MTETPADQPHVHTPEEIQDWQDVASVMHTWHPDLRTHAQRIIEQRDIPVARVSIDGQSGRNISVGEHSESVAETITLDRNEIRSRGIRPGCTEIVLQRHGMYVRDTGSPDVGRLTPGAIQLETESATRYFREVISSVPEAERDRLTVLFVASDTRYAGGGQRSYQTTEIAQHVAEKLFQGHGVHPLSILNISPYSTNEGAPIVMKTLREPQMFGRSPDFVEFMRQRYGDLGKDFWIAFEEDTEQATRLEMGAEGPDEIADRMRAALSILAHCSELVHQDSPGTRLIIWAGTHYDTISPFVKRDVLRKDKNTAVLVDYGGGVVVDINQSKQASTVVSGSRYMLNL